MNNAMLLTVNKLDQPQAGTTLEEHDEVIRCAAADLVSSRVSN